MGCCDDAHRARAGHWGRTGRALLPSAQHGCRLRTRSRMFDAWSVASQLWRAGHPTGWQQLRVTSSLPNPQPVDAAQRAGRGTRSHCRASPQLLPPTQAGWSWCQGRTAGSSGQAWPAECGAGSPSHPACALADAALPGVLLCCSTANSRAASHHADPVGLSNTRTVSLRKCYSECDALPAGTAPESQSGWEWAVRAPAVGAAMMARWVPTTLAGCCSRRPALAPSVRW
jgi:hypothetical protein